SLARRSLEAQGYRVLSASSVREANAMLAAGNGAGLRSLDLLVTDVVMPGQSGRSLAQELHTRRPDLKILYISGHTDDAVVAHGVHESSAAFLQKPFSPEDLARKVRSVLDSRVH
ncbi:MAG: response regulator, partial [Gemmatimonadales bacterium]